MIGGPLLNGMSGGTGRALAARDREIAAKKLWKGCPSLAEKERKEEGGQAQPDADADDHPAHKSVVPGAAAAVEERSSGPPPVMIRSIPFCLAAAGPAIRRRVVLAFGEKDVATAGAGEDPPGPAAHTRRDADPLAGATAGYRAKCWVQGWTDQRHFGADSTTECRPRSRLFFRGPSWASWTGGLTGAGQRVYGTPPLIRS